MKLVFWQKMISMHQAYYLKILAESVDVILAVQDEISEDRVLQGWSIPNTGNIKIVFIKTVEECEKFVNDSKDYLHFFGGFKGNDIQNFAFKKIIKNKIKVGIIAESAIQLGFKTFFKKILYRFYALKYNKYVEIILAMGELGVNWYVKSGFDKNKIHQFQYFTELPINFVHHKKIQSQTVRFTFVGQIIYRKGVDILIDALSHSINKDWVLSIIGTGDFENKLKNKINNLGLTKNVIFLGNKKNEEILSFLESNTDYLILPSRFDGWGAVINESFSVGTPVIVSDKCGAASMVINDDLGYVFNANDKKHLSNIINEILKNKLIKYPNKIKDVYQKEFTIKKVLELKNILDKK